MMIEMDGTENKCESSVVMTSSEAPGQQTLESSQTLKNALTNGAFFHKVPIRGINPNRNKTKEIAVWHSRHKQH